jgi:3-deoxy-manno-octulosonate cytidylyltransferase (CMP-KDO synthetase)
VTKFSVVIPARLGSTRIPNKPLADIAGKPMVVRVWELASKSGADQVVVATDDERIGEACDAVGARWQLTRANHASGTDRIAEVASLLGWPDDHIVVNLQGDEPAMPVANVAQVAKLLSDCDAGLATLAVPMDSTEDWQNPAVVKVVTDTAGRALYFSRAPIPHVRDQAGSQSMAGALRHLGLYSYRVAALQRLTQQPPCPLERTERLEQLRALWMGMSIQVGIAEEVPPPGVDTAEDLASMVRLFEGSG